jgi:hypothetical protein
MTPPLRRPRLSIQPNPTPKAQDTTANCGNYRRWLVNYPAGTSFQQLSRPSGTRCVGHRHADPAQYPRRVHMKAPLPLHSLCPTYSPQWPEHWALQNASLPSCWCWPAAQTMGYPSPLAGQRCCGQLQSSSYYPAPLAIMTFRRSVRCGDTGQATSIDYQSSDSSTVSSRAVEYGRQGQHGQRSAFDDRRWRHMGLRPGFSTSALSDGNGKPAVRVDGNASPDPRRCSIMAGKLCRSSKPSVSSCTGTAGSELWGGTEQRAERSAALKQLHGTGQPSMQQLRGSRRMTRWAPRHVYARETWWAGNEALYIGWRKPSWVDLSCGVGSSTSTNYSPVDEVAKPRYGFCFADSIAKSDVQRPSHRLG